MPMVDQKAAFNDRLKRINSGKQYEHQDVVGYQTQKRYEKKYAPAKGRKKRSFTDFLMIPIAFSCGVIAVFLGRLIYFHLSQMEGMPEAFATLGSKGMLLSVVVIAGLLTALFHLSTKGRMPALLMGCAFMHFGEAAMAATAPDVWAELFSADYTAALVAQAASLGLIAG